MFWPALAFSAIPFLEASFCERGGLIRRVPSKPAPICEAGEKGVLLGMKKGKDIRLKNNEAAKRHKEQKSGVRSQNTE